MPIYVLKSHKLAHHVLWTLECGIFHAADRRANTPHVQTARRAEREVERLVLEKLRKGYKEVSSAP